ncbi:MAG: cytochrome c4 [Betaproteobacteria bacterium]|nr:cytochrome c4 [Betaproteobacteria bacterium]
MKITWHKWALIAGVLAMSGTAFAAPPSPEMLANACAGCHGTNGASAGPSMPSLAGQSQLSIVESMKGFKSGDRPSTVMGRLAKGYSDADYEAMGGFFSRQKLFATSQSVDKVKATKGEELHEKNCARCHVENGKEIKDNSPILARQWVKYLEIQMQDYASGKRKMFDRKEEKMKPLSKEDLEAIAHFYASVK